MTLSKMQLEIEVDKCLRRFADTLQPSEEYHDIGVRLCEKVLITLSTAVSKSRLTISSGVPSFSIPIAYFGGTINRYNDPNPSPLEFDMVVKIANRQPPFSDVLDFIDTTLRNNAFRLQIAPRTIKNTAYMVQFSFTNGISVTMLAVSAELSQEEICRQIKGDSSKSPRYFYSTNLQEKQIDFIKQQSFYAQKIGRLAKFWYQNMDLIDGASVVVGGAVMFDLLAIAAVLEEEAKGHGREAVLRAFSRVVELVEKLDVLSLGFEREYGQYGPWKVKTHICTGIEQGINLLPRLTEPNNSKFNILLGIRPEAVGGFQREARMMRKRLNRLIEKQEYCDVVDTTIGEGEVNAKCLRKVSLQIGKIFGAFGEKEVGGKGGGTGLGLGGGVEEDELTNNNE